MYLQVMQAGEMEYLKCLQLQQHLLCARQKDEIPDTLILVKHPPVITMGRNANLSSIIAPSQQLKEMGIPVYETERGGDAAYHGPGQLVGYPVMSLKERGKNVHDYYSALEQVIIELLKRYDITAGRDHLYPGVWIGEKKIAAIGIAVKKWVTMHGFALNVFPDPWHTELIIPCGITGRSVTSLQELVSQEIDTQIISKEIIDIFSRIFALNPIHRGAASFEAIGNG